MGKNERRAYLKAVIERYQKASKNAKSAILDEFCSVCDYNHKYAIRLLNRQRKGSKRRPGRKPVYHNEQRCHDALGGLPPTIFREQKTAKNSTYELST